MDAHLKATVTSTGTADDGAGTFEAVASTSTVDREGESIAPGAFEPLPQTVPLFYQHDWMDKALPVGSAVPFYDVDRKLKLRGRFADTPRAQELRKLVRDGHVKAMSVGFVNGKRRRKGDGTSEVTKGDLIEVSFTSIPVNPTALVTSSKAHRGQSDAAFLARMKALASVARAELLLMDEDEIDRARRTVRKAEALIAKMERNDRD